VRKEKVDNFKINSHKRKFFFLTNIYIIIVDRVANAAFSIIEIMQNRAVAWR
jgi:hypothetical protein